MQTYIIYYEDKEGNPQGFEVYGTDRVKKAIRDIKQEGGKINTIYKRGKNFFDNPDDVVDVTLSYYK